MREVNGFSGAAPIWHQFMRAALSGKPVRRFDRPAGLVQVEVCKLSGLLPSQDCPYRRLEWFILGTQPTRQDTFYREVSVDRSTGRLATATTPPDQRLQRLALDLPPQAYPWARSQGLLLYADLTGVVSGKPEQPSALAQVSSPPVPVPSLVLLSPAEGSVFRLSDALTAQAQRIRLEAASDLELVQVTLWVDGKQIASLESAPYQAWWTLTPGLHRAWAQAILADGGEISSPVVSFTVLE
jgi:membrane carboxypeptidase/penicillin-binding protein PbpC